MQADRSQKTKSLCIQVAICHPDAGPGGIGIAVPNVGPTVAGRIYEQAYGSRDELTYRAVFRALELGKRLGVEHVSILCPDEKITRQINREAPVPQQGKLPLLYMKVKSLMYTYGRAEVVTVPDGRVRAAYKLALTASRIPVPVKTEPRTLFTLDPSPAV